ncbi:ATP-binding cassette domain-containing protein [Ornithinibacillus halotolerans]|uniref:ABC transporter n=1 Tax=Ornithinibacillus halotolerans TaxID=1274357 RepID=A0A916W9C9_9BACI|nr:ABC transporter ATP-binding protein [Ornithinibacillus halotolerans]GGA77800.1 ABC transporter [Ornithinibacillus halotolerans]
MNVIECKDLVKNYGGANALDHLSVFIKENTITGLIGRNGAGKTTLLKIIAGFWKATSGEVKVFNRQPFNNLIVSANSIFVDDMMDFTSALTIKELLDEAKTFYPNWDHDLAEGLLNYFEFNPNQSHQSLSKGKKSTYNMIIGLASKCALTIFDEPTTGMDAAVRKDFYRALLKDYIQSPRTIIISSHHLDEVEDLLEDVLLIHDGKTLLHLSIEELKEYAVKISGRTALVMQYLDNKEVIYKEEINSETCSVIVRNNFPHESVKRLGITVSSVKPSDLCVYLTSQSKGGIDDVFSKRESV